jgi:acyl-CoA synthetase (AMP-forming)/AMP-acid ligase II
LLWTFLEKRNGLLWKRESVKMADGETPSLRDLVANARAPRFFWDQATSLRYTDLDHATSLGGSLDEMAGRSVLLATAGQLTTALALIELDAIARRIVILPPDAEASHLDNVADTAGIDAVVIDHESSANVTLNLPVCGTCLPSTVPMTERRSARIRTEWVLMTSGTTGMPKMVVHDLTGLSAAIRARSVADGASVWGTFYDIRRYGGLQIFLRAVFSGASLVLSEASEPVADHLTRLAKFGVTHLSGTPSQWRRALMSPAIHAISPRYVRLSGEIADQAVLDSLGATFPQAAIGHAYASTEAGVGFDVNDGLAGFPAEYVGSIRNGVEIEVFDDSLHVRSRGIAAGYVGGKQAVANVDGFVDTGDIVERRGDRYHFIGRKSGIINIGGLKVHPEEVEAVINRHPQVKMSHVHPKQNPVTGSIVVADVVLKSEQQGAAERLHKVREDILKLCRETLPRHKVPVVISFVPALKVAATGKLLRRNE